MDTVIQAIEVQRKIPDYCIPLRWIPVHHFLYLHHWWPQEPPGRTELCFCVVFPCFYFHHRKLVVCLLQASTFSFLSHKRPLYMIIICDMSLPSSTFSPSTACTPSRFLQQFHRTTCWTFGHLQIVLVCPLSENRRCFLSLPLRFHQQSLRCSRHLFSSSLNLSWPQVPSSLELSPSLWGYFQMMLDWEIVEVLVFQLSSHFPHLCLISAGSQRFLLGLPEKM